MQCNAQHVSTRVMIIIIIQRSIYITRRFHFIEAKRGARDYYFAIHSLKRIPSSET